ncbi:Oidioi.mRNA.OKI2018_I69.chr2.g8103.t1.cds [Oikopleura dioica]|uniref:Oidioi.mRNA.OKI2018_I69.chr2.g8103.t1.cds n=1 Tax=Oikopleura dioica TaxID=34765 RepID=A0ABN7T880_OIKDI|nr:Oidioi.mRNA.OKI2018_I69.chr2.g8103.t1.cds [Oikopleura dioica]
MSEIGRKVLLIGDSMLSHIDEDPDLIIKISYPGIQTWQLNEILDIEVLPSPERVFQTIEQISWAYRNLIQKLETIYKDCFVLRSLCVPRQDQFAERAKEINEKIRRCPSRDNKGLDYDSYFDEDPKWYHTDGLHLSNEGLEKFAEVINRVAKNTLESPKNPDRQPIDWAAVEKWRKERTSALGDQQIRYRKTNYQPILETISPVLRQLEGFNLAKYPTKQDERFIDEKERFFFVFSKEK